MTATWIDHTWTLLLIAALPAYASVSYRRFVRAVARGEPDVRAKEYTYTILMQWALAAALLATWLAVQGRTAAALGLTIEWGLPSIIVAALSVVLLLVLAAQLRAVSRMTREQLAGVRAQMEAVAPMLPATPREHALFRWLAVTAGVCEELLYRGFLLWYLAQYVGSWPAVGLGAAAFGLAHAYQGRAGVLKTGAVGALAGALYVASGSLFWPILLHAAIDLQAGIMVRLVRDRSAPEAPAAAAATAPEPDAA